MATATRIRPTINDNQMPEILDAIADSGIPYAAKITVEGTNTLLFDRYNQDEIDVKKALPKGHVGKKMVDPEAQVYRHPKSGNLAVPGIAFLNAIEDAAKYVQTVPGRLEHSCKPLVVDLAEPRWRRRARRCRREDVGRDRLQADLARAWRR